MDHAAVPVGRIPSVLLQALLAVTSTHRSRATIMSNGLLTSLNLEPSASNALATYQNLSLSIPLLNRFQTVGCLDSLRSTSPIPSKRCAPFAHMSWLFATLGLPFENGLLPEAYEVSTRIEVRCGACDRRQKQEH